MKKTILILLALFFISCNKETESVIEEVAFECDIQAIGFISAAEAAVTFKVSLATDVNFPVKNGEITINEDGQITIGDSLAHISDWKQESTGRASFKFYYGKNLGPFCMEAFSAIPPHTHDNFRGTATLKADSGKSPTGTWIVDKEKTDL